MTNEEAKEVLQKALEHYKSLLKDKIYLDGETLKFIEATEIVIKAIEQQPIDKSAMMYEIYMEGVNMSGEYQGCWVRFKDIEKIVDKYMGEKEVDR